MSKDKEHLLPIPRGKRNTSFARADQDYREEDMKRLASFVAAMMLIFLVAPAVHAQSTQVM
ncbi:MAG: hypothetical protein ACRD4K_04835, partial [Candidatus Acidiferrales bacterium]